MFLRVTVYQNMDDWLKKGLKNLIFYYLKVTIGQNGLLLLFSRLIRDFFREPINLELGGTTVLRPL